MMVYSAILMCEELGWIQFTPVAPLSPFIPPQLIEASYTPVLYDKVKIFAPQDVFIPIGGRSIALDTGLQVITERAFTGISIRSNDQTNFKITYADIPSHGYISVTIESSTEHEIHIKKDDYIADLAFYNNLSAYNINIAEW